MAIIDMKRKEHYKNFVVEAICFLFILLFIYAAISKLLDYQEFKVQIGQSPLLTAFADWVAWAVPTFEIITSFLLAVPIYRFWGLCASYCLMIMFTSYIFIILNYSLFVPCSCGGILEKLGWREHFTVNLFFIFLALIGILISGLPKSPTPKSLYREN